MIGTLISALAGPVDKLVGRFAGSQEEKDKAIADFRLAVVAQEGAIRDAAASIVLAEARGESWLQRNWRPLMMLVIVAIIANNYLLYPYFVAFGLPGVMLDLPETLWELMKIGLGGYVVGRSAEKVTRAWKGGKDG